MNPPGVALRELVSYLDEYLDIRAIPDDANAVNGLQVENRGRVGRVVAAVDASLTTIENIGGPPERRSGGPALLLVHHGMLWDGNRPMEGRRYRKLRALLAQDAALYSAHIPLDVHPEVGNNALLAQGLGLQNRSWFGDYKGVAIGVAGDAPARLETREAVVEALAARLGVHQATIRLIPGGPPKPGRIGVITGGAGSMIAQAGAAGCDTFISGEGAAHTYFDATELGLNVLYAGHYATETLGVKALAEHLATRFGLPWEFHDHPTGM